MNKFNQFGMIVFLWMWIFIGGVVIKNIIQDSLDAYESSQSQTIIYEGVK